MTASIDFDVEKLIKNLQKAEKKAIAAFALYGDTASKKLETYAKSNHPWQNRTHEAEKRLYGSSELKGKTLTVAISHGVDYGPSLELGSGPRLIKPTSKKALYWDGADHPVKYVNHPGTMPYPILTPTIEANANEILSGLDILLGGK